MDAGFRSQLITEKRRVDSLERIKAAARKLFIERGFHATRPQDIAQEAGLGHGTFYLHYADKRACFLAFVDDARTELNSFIRGRVSGSETLEQSVARTLEAICEYAETNPGMAGAAMIDEALIGAARLPSGPLVHQWGYELAQFIRKGVRQGTMDDTCAPDILGQAIAGAVCQCWQEGIRQGMAPQEIADQLVRFISRGLGA